eukprot:CAMPEP_0179238366 /NCGR_PEP_ID=MMETSP0797-20121207/14912_1 /TAXON_ID=47934 /ORGANISM="Dinophysis acuminata, Strain DAEP01" /LENGTH=184 /DNA_ID=CAMNT_0020945663 /DNA_START=31 /DNA_END=583 /DNA_ORIENTATION=-
MMITRAAAKEAPTLMPRLPDADACVFRLADTPTLPQGRELMGHVPAVRHVEPEPVRPRVGHLEVDCLCTAPVDAPPAGRTGKQPSLVAAALLPHGHLVGGRPPRLEPVQPGHPEGVAGAAALQVHAECLGRQPGVPARRGAVLRVVAAGAAGPPSVRVRVVRVRGVPPGVLLREGPAPRALRPG